MLQVNVTNLGSRPEQLYQEQNLSDFKYELDDEWHYHSTMFRVSTATSGPTHNVVNSEVINVKLNSI